MAMVSPRLFICVVSVGSACGMVAVRKHLEGKARNLGDDVISARLEAGGGFARNVVLEFVEQVADGVWVNGFRVQSTFGITSG